ncbi:fructosamine kinase [Haloferax sulfurifontis ATCC BAA-897]|uniref:Fructosamine kinase n=1 Tax=Haloferax sulfurifontis ATCC BAA-897 TaxID=662480 RepID=M0I9U1_9EURY|nr:fructosamine kinase [Haloferax sulfurifontis ATCC BAA-897]
MTLDSDLAARVTDALDADAPPPATTELDGGHVGRVYRLDFDGRDPVVARWRHAARRGGGDARLARRGRPSGPRGPPRRRRPARPRLRRGRVRVDPRRRARPRRPPRRAPRDDRAGVRFPLRHALGTVPPGEPVDRLVGGVLPRPAPPAVGRGGARRRTPRRDSRANRVGRRRPRRAPRRTGGPAARPRRRVGREPPRPRRPRRRLPRPGVLLRPPRGRTGLHRLVRRRRRRLLRRLRRAPTHRRRLLRGPLARLRAVPAPRTRPRLRGRLRPVGRRRAGRTRLLTARERESRAEPSRIES